MARNRICWRSLVEALRPPGIIQDISQLGQVDVCGSEDRAPGMDLNCLRTSVVEFGGSWREEIDTIIKP